jgi:hypothetical protein
MGAVTRALKVRLNIATAIPVVVALAHHHSGSLSTLATRFFDSPAPYMLATAIHPHSSLEQFLWPFWLPSQLKLYLYPTEDHKKVTLRYQTLSSQG